MMMKYHSKSVKFDAQDRKEKMRVIFDLSIADRFVERYKKLLRGSSNRWGNNPFLRKM